MRPQVALKALRACTVFVGYRTANPLATIFLRGLPCPRTPAAYGQRAARSLFRFGAPCVLAVTGCGMTWRAGRVEFPLRVPHRLRVAG